MLELLQQGDADAAQVLHDRYANRLRALAKRQLHADLSGIVDADDIVQSVFRTFLRGVAEARFRVPEGDDLWGLLLVLALNKVRASGKYHRAAKRDVRRSMPLEPDRDGAGSGSKSDFDPFLRAVADDLMGQFLPIHREMIELRLQGHGVSEIAAQTRRSKRTVERILQECRVCLVKLVGLHE